MLIDTHCHLDAAEFDADRDRVISAALAAGVMTMVVPAVCRDNLEAVAQLAQAHPSVRVGYGIHPLFVNKAEPDDVAHVRDRLAGGDAVAVGEIGLDFFVEGHDAARQTYFFVEQLKLARAFDLPVILHVRRAQDVILKHLRAHKVCGGIAHAFNGSAEQAAQFIKLGIKLGFGGAMTYPRALKIRALAASLPIDALVLETDAPDIPPEWVRGQRNDPANLPRIAAVLAALRRLNVDDIIAHTRDNALAALPALRS